MMDNKVIAQLESECKFVKKRSVENGHDCWGNLEWNENKYIEVGGKEEYVGDGWFVIHNGNEAFDCVSKDLINWAIENAKQILANRLQTKLKL